MKKDAKEAEGEEIRYIVRILNTDLDGNRKVHMALTGIKGVGRRCARIFADTARVDPRAVLGRLSDDEIDSLKKVIEESESNLPGWMKNRRKDMNTGEDKHIMGTDVATALREDLDLMKKIRSYKGIRHERGLRVRGQKTRSTGRKGTTVGVSRKKIVK